VISDIQVQQLEHAARDVHISASSLIQQTEKILPNSKVLSTPRRKRLLPASELLSRLERSILIFSLLETITSLLMTSCIVSEHRHNFEHNFIKSTV
jgi:hypothetical protein